MKTMQEPPAGVVAGDSVPRENEASEYERMKQQHVETLAKTAEYVGADQ